MNRSCSPGSWAFRVVGTVSLSWILLLACTAVGCGSRNETPLPPPGSGRSETSIPARSKSSVPIQVGNVWRYRETRRNRRDGSETIGEICWQIEEETRAGYRVAVLGGDQIIDHFFLVDKGGHVGLYEYESQAEAKQMVLTNLNRDSRWDVDGDERGAVIGEEVFELDEESHTAYVVAYERYFGEDWTDDPRWYPDGEAWFVPGIGIVHKDSTSRRVPPRTNPGVWSDSDPEDPDKRLAEDVVTHLLEFKPRT